MVGQTISHYEITEKLGEGGMGVVYKASDTKLDRTVALKFLPFDSTSKDKDKKRFLREARAAARLNHPNICSIHSIQEHDGLQFIEMEYVEGVTLREKMQKSDRLPLKECRDYATQIIKALAAAHEKSIIHRDIKPENILVDTEGRIKVMDFGLAKLKDLPHFTQSGSTVGTATYMSPEQMKSEEIDERSDIFSFGIVLYEMLTGVHPFKAEYEQALMYNILNEHPEGPSSIRKDVDRELEDIVVRCLKKSREDRYRTAGEILSQLQSGAEPLSRMGDKANNKLSRFQWLPQYMRLGPKARAAAAILLVLTLGVLWLYPTVFGGGSQEPIPDEKHIVVLPFENLSSQEIPEAINDGIMEVLASKITRMESYEGSISVVPTSEVREARSEGITGIKEVTSRFGANLAVNGSLQRVDNQLLLTINLVDGNSMRQIRSSVLQMKWDNLVALQEKVARKLTDMLEVELKEKTVQTFAVANTQPSSIYQQYLKGQGYLSRFEDPESIDSAIEIFKKIVEKDTGYVRAYADLAEAYWRKYELTRNTEWTDHALKYGRKAINLSEEYVPEAFITMAIIKNSRGQHKEALDFLNDLEGPEINSYQALTEQAEAYQGLGQPEKAEKMYLKAIERKPKYWGGYNNLGVFYYNQGQVKKAAEVFDKLLENAPNNFRAFSNLGGIYFNRGMFEKALSAWHQSIAIEPNFRAYDNLGTYYYRKKDFNEAIRMYKRAIELGKTDYRSWGNLGYAYYWSGKDSSKVRKNLNKAIDLAEKELEIRPSDPTLLSSLAGYYLTIGNDKKCRELLQQLISVEKKGAHELTSIIHLYERLGERESALQWVEKWLSEGYGLGTLHSLNGVDGLLEDPRMKKLEEKYKQQNQH